MNKSLRYCILIMRFEVRHSDDGYSTEAREEKGDLSSSYMYAKVESFRPKVLGVHGQLDP